MRLLFIRHADPDYARDSLTEKGHREAALLGETAADLDLGECWMSPWGRAQDTAAYCLKKTGKTAKVGEWLHEFFVEMDINADPELAKAYPDAGKEGDRYTNRGVVWDMLPSYMSAHPEYYSPTEWRNSPAAGCGNLNSVYDWVTGNLDQVLADHGYVRENLTYRVERENRETITFFCHFGVICAMLSHLWNVSPFVLWHSLALMPSSVTELITEERQQGTAWFRARKVGDLSHLYMGRENPSFACRFCEVFSSDERH